MSSTTVSTSADIFRAYDIRGIVGQGLDNEIMTALGRAIGSEAIDQGQSCLVLGSDTRLSSPEFHESMKTGILSTGCNVIDIGNVPSPLLYFATHTLSTSSGIMITGSHNPGHYNGVKIVMNNCCLADQQIQQFRTRIEQSQFHHGDGILSQLDIFPAYLERVCTDISLSNSYKVVIDAGNGVAGLTAPTLFEQLGCEVVPLYCEPDGHFPNHHPDPTDSANLSDLINKVSEVKADLGIAFDGDGDRVGLISAGGRILDADKILMCFLTDILADNPGASVVFDVKSSFLLPTMIEANQGHAIMCKSGHSFVKRKMQETNAILGGEYSAHIFFKHRWYGFDDGLYTAARFLELMNKYSSSADDLLDHLPESISTPELSICVEETEKFELIERLSTQMVFVDARINKLDGLRADFKEGWGLIRASNTSPKLTLRFEALDADNLHTIMARFSAELTRLAPELTLPF